MIFVSLLWILGFWIALALVFDLNHSRRVPTGYDLFVIGCMLGVGLFGAVAGLTGAILTK